MGLGILGSLFNRHTPFPIPTKPHFINDDFNPGAFGNDFGEVRLNVGVFPRRRVCWIDLDIKQMRIVPIKRPKNHMAHIGPKHPTATFGFILKSLRREPNALPLMAGGEFRVGFFFPMNRTAAVESRVPTQHPSRFADVRDSEKFAAEIARAAISH